MASSFSSRSLPLVPRPSTAPTPPGTLKTFFPAVRFYGTPSCRSTLGFPALSCSTITRQSSKVSLKVAESDPQAINGIEDNQVIGNKSDGKVDLKDLPALKTLIKTYKEAIISGDENSISDIEAAIYFIDNEKNELYQKVENITTDIVSGKEKVLRIKADLENFRKRSEKDRLTFTDDVQGDVIESLLPMVDSFERAKKDTKAETEREQKIDTSYQGIYKQFVEVMRSLNVAVVETVGKRFDPSIHEAIAREESQQFEEGIIIEEVCRGFLYKDRLLRPATVKVSMGPGPRKAPSATEKATEQSAAAAEQDEGPVHVSGNA